MNDRRQLEEWDEQTEKTQSVQRTGTENRGSKGGNERSMKKKKRGGACSHVKIITQTQTLTQHFFQKDALPPPSSRISGWPHLPEDQENVKRGLKHDAKERDAHVREQRAVLETFAYMCYEVS